MLGEAIKHYRNMHKMTQQEPAKIISCSVDIDSAGHFTDEVYKFCKTRAR